MEYIYIILLFIILIIFFSYIIVIYNKLGQLDREIDDIWNDIYIMIDDLIKIIKESKLNSLKKIVNGYNSENVLDVIETYLKLEKKISCSRNKELKKVVNEINEKKLIYNDKTLKYNNMVNSVVYCIVSKVFGFKPRVYFRNIK